MSGSEIMACLVFNTMHPCGRIAYFRSTPRPSIHRNCDITTSGNGKIALDDGIDRYLNDIPTAWGHLTVRQLLTHTAGLPDILDASGEIRGNGREQAAWEEVTGLRLVSKPGDRFDYNQTRLRVVGSNHKPGHGGELHEFHRRQTIPCRSHDAYPICRLGGCHRELGRRVRADQAADGGDARPNGWAVEFDRFPIFLRPAAGIVSTAQDMARWVIALQSGVLLKRREACGNYGRRSF